MTDAAKTSRTNAKDGTIITPRIATLLGFGAVLLWSTLASLTSLKGGDIPPFQTTAITFLIGGITIAAIAILSGRAAAMVPTPASLALGIYGLFVFHVLYFAALKLAPAAEASLIAALWALLTVLFSGLLPGHTLHLRHVVGALLGLAAATLLVWNKIGGSDDFPHASLGFVLAFGCALVWSSYSVMSRLVAKVPSESLALPCFITAALAFVCSLMFEDWVTPQGATPWVALLLLGLGPVGAAFLIWDIGMKRGNVAYLGVLGYASPVISTGLLIVLGLASPSWSLVIAVALILIAAKLAAPERNNESA
ncbi:DMT family transporter [Pseudorhodoplanes sinuspersici]|uniref:aromatic amino acid exporter YddG n=1 Tax=Pseudorhodoplanes sinuspersici TaxID=1235591 RepID=UPI000FF75A57|nr:EamA family transporter [Pseudorhodoplanes sinuspersici]RKE67588.1 EamA domain-containing membrane protein RarD [Pseudorhodoplanes sinuspersici]